MAHADEGIKSYAVQRQVTAGHAGRIQAHHLIEKRFADVMNQVPRDMLSIVVTRAEHDVFTQAWRQAIPYGSRNVSRAQVEAAARKIYAEYPGDPSSAGILMADYVELSQRRNRGWPWPEDSCGLGPMYGEDGWCRSCGVPKRDQLGSLVLQSKGLSRLMGAWVPNWRFEAICLEKSLSEELSAQFELTLMPIQWHGSPPGDATQIVVHSTVQPWFEPGQVAAAANQVHGLPGADCGDCGIWRWMPLGIQDLPRPSDEVLGLGEEIIASPEWFGDGARSFRQILVSRDLANRLASAAARDFRILDLPD